MKKLLLLSLSAFLLQSCNSSSDDMMLLLPDNSQNVSQLSSSSSSNDNPAFTRKLKNKKSYTFKADLLSNSICGANDLQHVNDYDGSLGQSKSFVKKYQDSVGALEYTAEDTSSKFCSGTLIGNNLFLTASHCVDGGIVGKSVAFDYEKNRGDASMKKQDHYKVTKVIEDGDSNVLDYAIIELEGNPGAKHGFTPVKVEMPENGELLTIIQHPKGQVKQVEVGPKVGLSGVYMAYSDLDTEPGSSGSGVLNKDGYLVAVHTNGGCTYSGGSNKGVAMTEIAKKSKLVQQLAAKSK